MRGREKRRNSMPVTRAVWAEVQQRSRHLLSSLHPEEDIFPLPNSSFFPHSLLRTSGPELSILVSLDPLLSTSFALHSLPSVTQSGERENREIDLLLLEERHFEVRMKRNGTALGLQDKQEEQKEGKNRQETKDEGSERFESRSHTHTHTHISHSLLSFLFRCFLPVFPCFRLT